ncbi:MAG TPA: ATP-binding protein [Abditibacteriaceae bacterium]|jgi:light-regulated signal transduction histidine kinase (bacteriophytochrome)
MSNVHQNDNVHNSAAADNAKVAAPVDITNCDREPIHIPAAIQPHGALLVVTEPDWKAVQASTNVGKLLGVAHDELLGQSLDVLLGEEQRVRLANSLSGQALDDNPLYALTVEIYGAAYHAIVHRRNGVFILELEAASDSEAISFSNLYPVVRDSIAELQAATTFQELCDVCAAQVRHLTGFDKVMIYRFDEEWNGTVLAQNKIDEMDDYLDLKFPASDIPRQARELYLLNRLRLIADVEYSPVPVLPVLHPPSNAPLDLTFSTLRSVSPIHIEYLKNMGVGASMSISVIRDKKLWGLIACHHSTALRLPYDVRTACEFLGQVFALQLITREQDDHYGHTLRLKNIQSQLLSAMAGHDNWVDGLRESEPELLEFAGAQGVALCNNDTCVLMGQTPPEPHVQEIAAWLHDKWTDGNKSTRDAVYYTDSLSREMPGAEMYSGSASGLLAIEISEVRRSAILWFRPEVVQTVKWSGNPEKAVQPQSDGTLRLHPRKSFAMWMETVRGRSLPWQSSEIEVAADLRSAIISIVLRRAEKLAQISEKLQQTNSELASFSYSVSHDLRAPFRHITGFADLLEKRVGSTLDETSLRYLHTMRNSAKYAGTLVDNLLSFSQMGRNQLRQSLVDMNRLIRDTVPELSDEIGERTVHWDIQALPPVHGDPEMLRLVVRNLLSNAVKYTRAREEAHIEVGSREDESEIIFWVHDNGVGFDMRYVGKLFGVFQRLHSNEEFEGTGIGLANVRRIISRHGGRTWAHSELDRGATFSFSLPKEPPAPDYDQATRDDIT